MPVLLPTAPACIEVHPLTALRPDAAMHLLQAAVEQAGEAILITDALIELPGPRILYVNPAFLEMTGYTAAEVLGQTPRLLQGPKTDPNLLCRLRRCLKEGIPFHGEGINYGKGCRPYHAEWRIAPVRSARGNITHFMATLRDVTEHKRHKEQLEAQKAALEEANMQLRALATTDGLTGLRNHREFHAQMEIERERARRDGTPLSLVLLDVDHFKQYNDAFGHPAGDEVLKTLAGLLHGHGETTVELAARYGGEEFAVILPRMSADRACALAERLRAAVAAHSWPARPVTISLGVATLWEGEPPPLTLLNQADRALYQSKADGRDCVTHFERLRL